MKWLLLAFLGTTGAVIVALCLLALLVRGRLRRHHRVDPKRPTSAPITWLADPRAPARLHRRLAAVGHLATSIVEDHPPSRRRGRRDGHDAPVADIARALRAQAVRLDEQVARVAMLAPPARREPLRRLHGAIVELERTGEQLAHLSSEVLTPPVLAHEASGVADLAGQVERLAEAHRALLALDEANGLTTPSASSH